MQRLETALTALKNGEMVILIDSEDRENEGDLVLAAEFATPEKINFLIRQACGLVCLALESEQVDRLGLPPMVSENQSPRKTAFTVSIEAATGVSTGISAADRAHTIQVASNPNATPKDVVAPGHIFPLRAAKGGVLERDGHTEGSIELCKLAGLRPAAVICEIINEDGSMARKSDLEAFSKKFNIPIVTIKELIAFQSMHEAWILESNFAKLPRAKTQNTKHNFVVQAFKNKITGAEHALLITENLIQNSKTDCANLPIVRVHSECLTGDALGSIRCDCQLQLNRAITTISESESGGAIVYLKNQEGRGIGLFNKIEAYALQDRGSDTVEANLKLGFHADERNYAEAAHILKMRGLTSIRLLTSNPQKIRELENLGITITEKIALDVPASPENENYLNTKRTKLNPELAKHT